MEMKCPYCNCDMEKGYIQSRDNLFWCKKLRKVAALPPLGEAIQLVTPENSLFKGEAIEAYNCPKCKKIVISYGEK